MMFMDKKHYITQIVLSSLLSVLSIGFLIAIPINSFHYHASRIFDFENHGYVDLVMVIFLLVGVVLITLLSFINLFFVVSRTKFVKYTISSIFAFICLFYSPMSLHIVFASTFTHHNQFNEHLLFSFYFPIAFIITTAMLIDLFNSSERKIKDTIFGIIFLTIVPLIMFGFIYYFYLSFALLMGFGKGGMIVTIVLVMISGFLPSVFLIFFAQSFFNKKSAKTISTLISFGIILPYVILCLIFVTFAVVTAKRFIMVSLYISFGFCAIGWLLSPMYFLPFINKKGRDLTLPNK